MTRFKHNVGSKGSGSKFLSLISYFSCKGYPYFCRYSKYDIRLTSVVLGFTLSLFILLLLGFGFNSVWASTGGTTISTYMISTRDGSDPPKGVQEIGYDGKPLGDINQLKEDCPSEVAIFVHGWPNDQYRAKERLDRVKTSLESNNYIIPLIALSWNSDVTWENAKIIAQQNGPKLAHFIFDYMATCKHQFHRNVEVRLIGHSLGARVILSALDSLHENPAWKSNSFKIASVHLMGAAVDDEEVSKNLSDISNAPTNMNKVKFPYGEAIEGEVNRFYNLFDPEDNVLTMVYPVYEGNDAALGQHGMQKELKQIDKPSTPPYYNINVQNEVQPGQDADGIEDTHTVFCGVTICDEITVKDWDVGLCLAYYNPFGSISMNCYVGEGDNHAGYMGFRKIPVNKNIDEYDGAIDIVVQTVVNATMMGK
jgi:pimeloyl-ACP methyl ester carboxylesterase